MTDNIISVHTSLGVYYFSPLEIIRCKASNNYTWFYLTGNRKVLVAKTLGKYEAQLSENNFIRIHRTDIVNRLFVCRVEKGGIVWLTDGTCLTISKRRTVRCANQFNNSATSSPYTQNPERNNAKEKNCNNVY